MGEIIKGELDNPTIKDMPLSIRNTTTQKLSNGRHGNHYKLTRTNVSIKHSIKQ